MLPNLTVPVLNRYDLLQGMLESIDYPVRDLLIIDNGGSYGAIEPPELPTVEDVWVLSMPSNLGVAGSWNLGIKSFPHDSRWFITSNDVVFRPGALELLSTASSGSLTLSTGFPHWHTFAVGEDVVKRCGLFDERLYPAYFEDNDMMRRVNMAGIPVTHLPLDIEHDNSSTLNSDIRYQQRNAATFVANKKLYQQKIATRDITWSWDIDRRRAGEWER